MNQMRVGHLHYSQILFTCILIVKSFLHILNLVRFHIILTYVFGKAIKKTIEYCKRELQYIILQQPKVSVYCLVVF